MSFIPDPSQFDKLRQILLRGYRADVPKIDPDIEAIKNADLLTWAKHFLPEHFSKPPSAMHIWLAGQLDRMSAMSNNQ